MSRKGDDLKKFFCKNGIAGLILSAVLLLNLPLNLWAAEDTAAESAAPVEETAAAEAPEEEVSEETPAETSAEETAPPQPTEPGEYIVDEQAGDYGPDIFADSYCVLDMETGEVLMSCKKDLRRFPASCTKIMTALLVLENVENLDETLTFTTSAVTVDPSSSTLMPKAMAGEVMTVRDVLYGMMYPSGNECGKMLGEYVAGSEEAFAEMMNARAKEIGCENTHFVNAYGIHHPDHYTSAYDLALILREAMQNPKYREVNQAIHYTIPATNYNAPRELMITHALLNGSFPSEGYNIIGGKTGSTPQAGKCLATAVERGGCEMVFALMHSNAENYYLDQSVLMEYAYALHEHAIAPVEWVPVNDHVTTKDGLRVRFSPSTRGGIDYTCNLGDVFERRGIYGEWSKIIANGKVRYLSTAFLDSDDPENVPVTEAYTYEEPTEETTEETSEETESESEEVAETPEETTEEEYVKVSTESTEASSSEEPEENITDKLRKHLPLIIPAAVIILAVTVWAILFIRKKLAEKRRRDMLRHRKW